MTVMDVIVGAVVVAAGVALGVWLFVANAAVNVKLNTIHVLVNSNLTAAMQSELNALDAQLVLMKKLAGTADASDEERAAIIRVEARVAELRALLKDRHETQDRLERDV